MHRWFIRWIDTQLEQKEFGITVEDKETVDRLLAVLNGRASVKVLETKELG